MRKTKYPISKEFFPYTHLTFSMDRRMLAMARKFMGVPRFVWKDPELEVTERIIRGYQGGDVELLIMVPKGIGKPAPCFIDIHGGGFVLEAAFSHYRLAMAYARGAQCIVVFVRYRLAPDHPFPSPQEDCYCALNWVHEHTGELGIDPARIGIGGDSAGGTLAVTSCLMARDRGLPLKPLFQLLIYPWLDGRNNSESFRTFTDTPMWNSSLSDDVGPLINPDPELTPLAYRSPCEAESLAGMPPAYIEVAQFDSLHDDGVLYAQLLREESIDVEFHETHGTMHGFDTKVDAPTTQLMLAKRIGYMTRMFA